LSKWKDSTTVEVAEALGIEAKPSGRTMKEADLQAKKHGPEGNEELEK
jgi:hypothetical protein